MNSSSSKRQVLAIIPGILFALIGIFCIFHSVKERTLGAESENWPSVPGTVTQSAVGLTSDSSSTHPIVAYKYTVNGQQYASDRIRFAAIGSSKHSETLAITNKFSVGSTPDVFYDPDDPSTAVLQTGAFGRSWGLLFGGVVFLGFGFVCMLMGGKALLA